MPYRSKAQFRFLHARHPELAKKWDREGFGGDYKSLPDHAKKKAHREALRRKAGKHKR
jgi:hypothetical protein